VSFFAPPAFCCSVITGYGLSDLIRRVEPAVGLFVSQALADLAVVTTLVSVRRGWRDGRDVHVVITV
jgi:hypothetical protein